MLIWLTSWPSPLNAWVTSYGEVVRASGIGVAGFCGWVPEGSSARNLSPSRVLILMAAVVWLPTQAPFTLKVTATLLPASEMPVTWPTTTPATRTSLPGCSPASSAKYAVYPVPPPMIGRSAESKTPNAITASSSQADDRDGDGVALGQGLHHWHLAAVMGTPVGLGPNFSLTPLTTASHRKKFSQEP